MRRCSISTDNGTLPYNRYGRLRTYIRGLFYKIFGKAFLMFFDPALRNMDRNDKDKINSWIRDQYTHPVESTHSYDEVLGWFNENNIDFINSYPSCEITPENNNDYFEKSSEGNAFERIIQQIFMIFTPLGGEGGLFIFIGRKK